MEQNGFFRWVWRLNALLLALGGLFILGMAGWSMFFSPWYHRPPPEGHFAPVPKGAEKDHTYRLSALSLVIDRESLFQLGRWEGGPNKYGLQDVVVSREGAEYGGPDTVNLLAIDGATGTSHWLFRGFDREIVSEESVTRPDVKSDPVAPTIVAPGQAQPVGNTVIALVIHTIDADTNKDGALTDKDRQSLYVYRPGLGFAAKLIDVDYLLWSGQPDASRYLVVYERGRDEYAATYSLPDFKLLSEKPVPPVP